MQAYTKPPEHCILAYIAAYCATPRGKAAYALTIRRIENGEVSEPEKFTMAAENSTASERSVEALLFVLRSIQPEEGLPVIIRCGLEYPLRGVTEWMPNWKQKGWKNSDKKPVTSRENWIEIDGILKEFEGRSFSYQWIPASANDAKNAEVSALARKTATM